MTRTSIFEPRFDGVCGGGQEVLFVGPLGSDEYWPRRILVPGVVLTESSFDEAFSASIREKVDVRAPLRRTVITEVQQVVVDAPEDYRAANVTTRNLVAQTIFEPIPPEAVKVPDIEQICRHKAYGEPEFRVTGHVFGQR